MLSVKCLRFCILNAAGNSTLAMLFTARMICAVPGAENEPVQLLFCLSSLNRVNLICIKYICRIIRLIHLLIIYFIQKSNTFSQK